MGIDNKALYDTFSLFGKITSCKVATSSNGDSLGYGFICFETVDAAQQAIQRVSGMQIGDSAVFVGDFANYGSELQAPMAPMFRLDTGISEQRKCCAVM